ncbi:hypothetical protein IG631_17165 [Alternaria alternata]|nr:hypothetical protein IG631_17165 [Alternaria alternata]
MVLKIEYVKHTVHDPGTGAHDGRSPWNEWSLVDIHQSESYALGRLVRAAIESSSRVPDCVSKQAAVFISTSALPTV